MILRQSLTTVLLLLCAVVISAQESYHGEEAGMRLHGGFLFAHHAEMRHLNERHFTAYEIDYRRRFSGDKSWHHDYRLPSWGITGLVMPFPSESLGTAVAVFPYYYLPVSYGKRANLNLKLGTGLSFLSKGFDRIENHKNIAISSQMNVVIQLGADFSWRILPRLTWNTGLFFTHFSNGAIQRPNLGTNFPTISTGVAYRFGDQVTDEVSKTEFEKPRGIEWTAFLGAGFKQGRVGSKGVLPAITVQGLGEKRLSPKFSLGAGLEINYNRALPIAYEQKEYATDNLTPLRAGPVIHTAYHFGKMSIVAQLGAYLLDQKLVDGRIFNRFGLRHEINERIDINLTLRTHFAKADHFELGIVYRWPKKS